VNRLVLSARIVERGALRYTPAGVPALDATLAHEGEQHEEGTPRRVQLSIGAVALGAASTALGSLELGREGSFAGFLAAARNGRGVRFHITSIDAGA
jgi:primosomal replication protein N